MLDLNKLTPAPWQDGIAGNCNLVHFDGEDVHGVASVPNQTNKEFVILARAAFQIMMVRGIDWILLYRSEKDNKIITDCPSYGWIPGRWDDPFSAWVGADEWYKLNIEKA